MKIIINVGVSGAGKSTWSIDYIKKNPRTIRINRDDLRKTVRGTLDGYYQTEKGLLNINEGIINQLEEYILTEAYLSDLDVIIDNTNLKPSYINRWVDIAGHFAQRGTKKPDVWFKIFSENNIHTLKQRVNIRDVPSSWAMMDYIDKQVLSLETAVKYINNNFKNQIFNG